MSGSGWIWGVLGENGPILYGGSKTSARSLGIQRTPLTFSSSLIFMFRFSTTHFDQRPIAVPDMDGPPITVRNYLSSIGWRTRLCTYCSSTAGPDGLTIFLFIARQPLFHRFPTLTIFEFIPCLLSHRSCFLFIPDPPPPPAPRDITSTHRRCTPVDIQVQAALSNLIPLPGDSTRASKSVTWWVSTSIRFRASRRLVTSR